MSMTTRFAFIHFDPAPTKAKATSKWTCRNNNSGEELGEVCYYPAWRQYCYFPTCPAVYSAGCLKDIQTFLTALETERKIKASDAALEREFEA